MKHFDKTSIPVVIQLLGVLQHIKSRRLMIEALAIDGKLDIKKLGEGLNDSRWYVTRNIVTVLGKIADSWSAELLTKALKHSDERVRKETIKALSAIGGPDILPHLKPSLNDGTPLIRTAAGRAISSIKTDSAKNILLQELSKKDFAKKEFSEKKEFYSAISQFTDSEVKNYLLNTLKKGKFFKRSKHDETRACAAYALGMIGVKEAIPLLDKTKNSNNKFLKTCSITALNQLKKQDG
jgi:HEAT repeat protein